MGCVRRLELACTSEDLDKYADVVLHDREALFVVDEKKISFFILLGDGVSPISVLRRRSRLAVGDRSIGRDKIDYASVFEEHLSLSLKLAIERSRWNFNKTMAHEKRLTILEKGYSDELFRTDSTNAYQKTVPANALPYAEIESVGDMVTAVKSLGGNKVISSEAVLTPSFRSMTVTDLGGGKFQFDGYTSWQDGDWNPETGRYNTHTFLSVPLKAGIYSVTRTVVSESTSNTAGNMGMELVVNGVSYNFGLISVVEDTTIEIKIFCATGLEGLVGAVYAFDIREQEVSEGGGNVFEPKVIDTLATPLGEDDNFIAVEPSGTLVFENEGNRAVPSTVTYMLKGE